MDPEKKIPQKEPDYTSLLDDIFDSTFHEAADTLMVETKGLDPRTVGMTDAEKEEQVDAFWAENPVPFDEFVVSADHMNQPSLSPRQRDDVASFLGTDPKRVFLNPETRYRIGVLMWGKGCLSGDTPLTDQKSGLTKTMREWEEDGRPITLWTTDGKSTFLEEAAPVFKVGEEELYDVVLEDGRTFRAAGRHRVRTPEGWKEITDLGGLPIAVAAVPPSSGPGHRSHVGSETGSGQQQESPGPTHAATARPCTPQQSVPGATRESPSRGPSGGGPRSNFALQPHSLTAGEPRQPVYGGQRFGKTPQPGPQSPPAYGLARTGPSSPGQTASPSGSGAAARANTGSPACVPQNAPRGARTDVDSPGGYPTSPRLCGGPPREALKTSPSVPPSPAGVHGRSLYDPREGVRVAGEAGSRRGPLSRRRHTNGGLGHEDIPSYGESPRHGPDGHGSWRDSPHNPEPTQPDSPHPGTCEQSQHLEYVAVSSVSPCCYGAIYTTTVDSTGQYIDDSGIVHANSGKDWVCSLIQCWVVHILLCMKGPRKALGMPVGEPIDLVNVAYSSKQAKDVFFKKFHGRLKHWKWLWRKYLIVESSRALNREQHPDIKSNDREKMVHIKSDVVEFAFSISCHSAHSENESAEGKSPIFWIMDEAAAFRTADGKANGRDIYNTLKTSSISRFPNLYRGLAISYPRSRNDFQMQLYAEAATDPTMFRSKAKTWEVNPLRSKEDFADDYNSDPKTAKGMYECEPPGSEFGFFDEDNVNGAFLEGLPSKIRTRPAIIHGRVIHPRTGLPVSRQFVGKVLDEVVISGLRDKSAPRVAHVDGGLSGDRAGLVLAHGDIHLVSYQDPHTKKPATYKTKKLVVDAILYWEPDKARGLQVSLNNIASILLGIREKGLRLAAVSYDMWNSASAIEALTMQGIYCEMHNISTEDYTALRNAFNLGAVEIPCDQWSEWQLLMKELHELEGHAKGNKLKVDHPEVGSKDVADGLAGCYRLLTDPEARGVSKANNMPGVLLGSSGSRSTPFAATSGMRAPLTSRQGSPSVINDAIRQSQPHARLGRMVTGMDDDLPHVNKEGQAMDYPAPRIVRGR